eukprot:561140-Alexandrium_andersonii.AAC.1
MPLKGPVISSTRAEAMAVLLSLHSPLPVHCALDNIQAVRRANQIIGGQGSKQPWSLVRDGDVWQR